MIKYIIFCLLLMANNISNPNNTIKLGAPNGKYNWVYLGGLTEEFYSNEEENHRSILDKIGKEINLTFLVPLYKNRCSKFNDKLCWPQENESEVMNTYSYLTSELRAIRVDGWIGFSNGGYFLQELLHYKQINLPIITIGAAGRIEHKTPIQIMIGNDDTYAYNKIKELGYKFFTYDGGHEITYISLKNLLNIINNY